MSLSLGAGRLRVWYLDLVVLKSGAQRNVRS